MKKTIEQFKTKYTELPKLNIKKIWHGSYWDGPHNGLCIVDGIHCWFEMIEEYYDNNEYIDYDQDPDWESPWYRRYLLIKLTPEQLDRLEKNHDKFRRMVGWHCDYETDGKTRQDRFPEGSNITKQSIDQYYQESKTMEFFEFEAASNEHVIGWYEI